MAKREGERGSAERRDQVDLAVVFLSQQFREALLVAGAGKSRSVHVLGVVIDLTPMGGRNLPAKRPIQNEPPRNVRAAPGHELEDGPSSRRAILERARGLRAPSEEEDCADKHQAPAGQAAGSWVGSEAGSIRAECDQGHIL
jgi:hypothetical protein